MSLQSQHTIRTGLAVGIVLMASAVRPATGTTAASAPIDSASTGKIHGRVIAPSGPVGFAIVVVLGTHRGASSDEHGAFTISLVPPGHWMLRVTQIGYQPTLTSVEVRAGSDTELVLTISERSEITRRRHPVPDCDSTAHLELAGDPVLRTRVVPDTVRCWTASGSIFDFSLPAEFRRKQVMGIDSEVGEWDAGSTRITYDLGDYT